MHWKMENPCTLNIYEIDKENVITSQMEQWSILSNVVNYVQHGRNPKNFYDLYIKATDQMSQKKIHDILKEGDRHVRVRFWQ